MADNVSTTVAAPAEATDSAVARATAPLGEPVPNLDAPAKTSGEARYAGDFHPPSLLHAVIVRSPYPHARILSIDTAAARSAPGVAAVVTAHDLPDRTYLHHRGPLADRRVLAREIVRYVGEEVAAVAAETLAQARAAAGLVDVRYERRPPVTTIASARAPGAPDLHDHVTGNVSLTVARSWGDEVEPEPTDVTVRGRYTFPAQAHCCMEPNTVVAMYAAGRLELWLSTQAPHLVRDELAHVLDLDFDRIVVHEAAVGGGFGSKSKISEFEAVAAALAIGTGRPVRLALTRDEEFAANKCRHRFEVDLTTTARADGTLTARRAAIDVDNGAYNHSGPSVMGAATGSIASLHRVPHVEFTARLVYTTKHPGGQFRGYGNPQVTFAMESQLDEVAQRLGVDPVELRLRNANRSGDVTHAGYRLGSVGVTACLTAVRDEIGWTRLRAAGGSGHGVGVATAIQLTAAHAYEGADRSAAAVDVDLDGRVRLRFAGADAGTGQRTVLAQVVAAELGLAVAAVEVRTMESEGTPVDLGAWSSRGTYMGAHAARVAARAAATELCSRAARLASAPPDTAWLAGGRVGAGGSQWSIAELMAASGPAYGPVTAVEEFTADMQHPDYRTGQADMAGAYSFAAHAVEVDVDRRTGQVRVRRVVAAHDSGTVLNPLLAEGQVVGGVVMGLGAALGEELVYRAGRMVNPAYLHYPLPRAADAPPVRVLFADSCDPKGPYGAKGLGEIANAPTAAALANAVAHAVGVRVRDLPLTPDKVLAAMRGAAGDATRPRYHLWRRPDRWEVGAMRRLYPRTVEKLVARRGVRPAGAGDWPRELDRPTDLRGAHAALRAAGARPIAGGTDVLPATRQGIVAPTRLVDLMLIPDLAGQAHEADGAWRIGAAVHLGDLERPTPGHQRTPEGVVAAAVATIASPQIRAMATVGGNLSQANRCWFYRNGFPCYKRAGPAHPCYAVDGDHRFHHAVAGAHRCQAVTPSDLATVFTALEATATVAGARGQRLVPLARLYRGPGETVLGDGELLTAVTVPAVAARRVSAFGKLALATGDFAMVSACVSLAVDRGAVTAARVVLGAVAPTPLRLPAVERALVRTGARLDHKRLVRAVGRWRAVAHPLPRNGWKVEAATGLLLSTLERCLDLSA